MTSPEPPRLARERLARLLEGERWIRRIVVLDEVDSTNAVARALAAEGAPDGTVVLAESQAAGRGRRERPWYSPPGLGLYLSVLRRPADGPETLGRWTLVGAVAAAEACRRLGAGDVTIEWPNDLTWRGRKLGGVLVEARSAGSTLVDVVLGIGLNAAHGPGELPGELARTATSLRLACGRCPAREELAAACLVELGRRSAQLACGDWPATAAAWERLAPGARDRRVRVQPERGGPAWTGRTAGLGDDGSLRVRRDSGGMEAVHLVASVQPLD